MDTIKLHGNSLFNFWLLLMCVPVLTQHCFQLCPVSGHISCRQSARSFVRLGSMPESILCISGLGVGRPDFRSCGLSLHYCIFQCKLL